MIKPDFQHFPIPHQQWWYLCPVNSGYIPWHKKKGCSAPPWPPVGTALKNQMNHLMNQKHQILNYYHQK